MQTNSKPKDKFFIPVIIFGLFGFGVYFLNSPSINVSPGFGLNFFNVGQGDSALIKTPNSHYYLVDGGPDKSVLTSLGKELPPTSKEIEGIILSHPHADHVSGFNYVLDRYKVKKAYLAGTIYEAPEYKAFIEKLTALNIETIKVYQGYSFSDDNVNYSFFWPHQDEANAPNDINNDSLVLSVNYQAYNFLFLGDLSTKTQEQMLSEIMLPKVDVIKVSHHGSKTGTSNILLERVQPKFAVISVGKDNSYGHPAPSVLEKLSAQKVLRTDELGDIKFKIDANQLILIR